MTPIDASASSSTRASTRPWSRKSGTDVPEGTVIAELQRGYRMRDRVLRPALVVVANNPAGGASNNTNTATDNDSYTRDSGGIN